MKSLDETSYNNGEDPLESVDSSSSSNLIGTKLDDYQIMRRLGRGGMADVYVAMHQTLERQVALKVLRRQLASDASYVERFRREARAAAKLNHPNIVHVYEVGRSQEYHYIAQELIDGGNLKDEVERSGPLTPDAAVEVLRAVSSALVAAHQAGITHRDIKPENILRSQRGEIKVADFGLARVGTGNDLTQVGLTMGTPRYMSPEQVQGKTADSRSDLYSLGCTMYFLLSGRPPFEADDALAIAVQHMHETAAPLAKTRGRNDMPDWLIAIISRLMSKAPTDRFGSASQILSAIEQSSSAAYLGSSIGGTTEATILLQRAMQIEASRRQRQRLQYLAASVILIGAVVAGGWVASKRKPASIQRLLAPDLVPKKSTIEEQYLAAASRDDIVAWRSVSEYFPPTGDAKSKNAAYATKAELQLARLLIRMDRIDEARTSLIRLIEDPSVDRLYQIVALAELVELPGNIAKNQEYQAQLRQSYKALIASRPDAARALQFIIDADAFVKLESS